MADIIENSNNTGLDGSESGDSEDFEVVHADDNESSINESFATHSQRIVDDLVTAEPSIVPSLTEKSCSKESLSSTNMNELIQSSYSKSIFDSIYNGPHVYEKLEELRTEGEKNRHLLENIMETISDLKKENVQLNLLHVKNQNGVLRSVEQEEEIINSLNEKLGIIDEMKRSYNEKVELLTKEHQAAENSAEEMKKRISQFEQALEIMATENKELHEQIDVSAAKLNTQTLELENKDGIIEALRENYEESERILECQRNVYRERINKLEEEIIRFREREHEGLVGNLQH